MPIIVGAACGGVVFLALVVLLFKRIKQGEGGGIPQQGGRNGMEMGGLQARPKSMAPSFPRPKTMPRGVDSKLTGGMPEGWLSAVDQQSGEMYYYHGETGETQWEFPMAPRLALSLRTNPIKSSFLS